MILQKQVTVTKSQHEWAFTVNYNRTLGRYDIVDAYKDGAGEFVPPELFDRVYNTLGDLRRAVGQWADREPVTIGRR